MSDDSTTTRERTGVPLLKSDNFSVWEVKIKIRLRVLKLWSIIDGSEAIPSPVTESYADRVNLAISEIVLKLDDANTAHVLDFIANPKAMMEALTTLHASSSPADKAKIFGNFYGVSSSPAANLKTFLAEIRSINQQLTCIGFKMDSEVLAYFTLFKLPSELNSICSALLFGGKEVTLKFVLDSLEQTSVSLTSTVVVKTGSAMVSSTDSGRPRCTHCKRLGHLVETCYRLHPHPNP